MHRRLSAGDGGSRPLAFEQRMAASDGIHDADDLADRRFRSRFSRRQPRRAVEHIARGDRTGPSPELPMQPPRRHELRYTHFRREVLDQFQAARVTHRSGTEAGCEAIDAITRSNFRIERAGAKMQRARPPVKWRRHGPSFIGSSTGANNRELKFRTMLFLDGEPVNSVHNKSVAVKNVRFLVRRSR